MEEGYVIMRQRARQMRRQMTPAESRLWQALAGRQCGGMRFLRQRVMWQFILDFYCPAHLIGIEVDGSIHELPEVHLHDLAKETGLLEEKGITIIRFTNAEILGGTQTQWYTRILAEVKSK